ncbi:MAG: response regulator transcription factor [Chloroflexi bacterium]|nr:response regulator transcription factor [Chloroflexota bacterium]MDA1228427.1 response regulator transcription factor [Chloroflexota bacterium]
MNSFVFVFEPDADVCHFITTCLESQGYEVASETEIVTGISNVMQHDPGVVILAEDMPTLSGMDLLPLLRRRSAVPIIVTGKGTETAVVGALLQGADMYLPKPINHKEMVCRIGALLRRMDLLMNEKGKATDVEALENALLETVKNALTDTERRLFHCLLERAGRVVEHDELMVKVWGKVVKKERLRFYVHSLRRKLASAVSINLHTRNGVGYLLEHQVTKTEGVA